MLRLLPRLQQITVRALSAAAPNVASTSAKKDALAKLRKKTGYSYVNIRKAVEKFGSENLEEAEKWLRDLAKKEGWARAEKLGSRVTSQGVIAAQAKGNKAVVVELNCETDFVAACDVEEITAAALKTAETLPSPSNSSLLTQNLEIENVQTSKNRPVKEALAMTVGKLGENISLGRVEAFVGPENITVFAQSHPKSGTATTEMGRFVSVVGISRNKEATSFPTERLAAQICQHIIGMKPTTLGTPMTAPKIETKKEVAEGEKDELNEFYSGKTTEMDEDETQLLRQSFMLNPSQTIHEYLGSHGAEVLSFARMELGDKDNA
uniref:Elongation factor Ts, mitochondrial n=1 Tax=Panagrolaimus sp. JU765 TaxID=591449 RepID=A0AC34QXE3_9BILA